MSTEKHLKNPKRRRKLPETYRKRYAALKAVHRFTFRYRPKSGFTNAQKAAITRKWREYQSIVEMLNRDVGIFKPAKKSQLRYLKDESFKVTNKGVYVPGIRSEKIKKKEQAVRITGKGKNTRIKINLPARKEIYIPYPGQPDFISFCNAVIRQYNPDYLYIMNENGRGREPILPKNFMLYARRDLMPRIDYFERQYNRIPFVGVWVVYMNGRKRRKAPSQEKLDDLYESVIEQLDDMVNVDDLNLE